MRLFASDLIGVGMMLGMAGVSMAAPAWPAGVSGLGMFPAGATLARAGEGDEDARVEFDIPAQPLADALRRYASMTRRPTLFRSDLVEGRYSSAVQGRYSAESALYRLLDGTGLVAEKSDDSPHGGFILKAIEPTEVAPRTSLGALEGYPGLVQARVWAALCADARTTPGAYRVLLRFAVDENGWVRQPRLLGTSGDAQRDAAILAVLRGVDIGVYPPPGLPQPVTVLIVPNSDRHPVAACGG